MTETSTSTSPATEPPDAGADAACTARVDRHLEGAAVEIAGEPGGAPLGLGDPSLVYAPHDVRGFMSYTVVAPSSAFTRVATSTDLGATWTYASSVSAATPLTVPTTDDSVCGAPDCSGTWVHEVSSIVDDAADPDPTRRFKVFAHSYFITSAGVLRYDIGSIDMWTSADPLAGGWQELRLLGWMSSSERSSTGVSTVVTSDPALSPLLGSCVALTEPGALVRGAVIDLALGCLRIDSPTQVPIEIVMIRSTDHGATWSPVARVLDVADAVALGASGELGPALNAGDLFEHEGRHYLFVTPNGPVTTLGASTSGYRGCVLLSFSDIDAGALARCDGALAVVSGIDGPPGLFHGACTFASGATDAGTMLLTADVAASPVFELIRTGAGVP